MAVWTPGSYLVREYERNVEALAARAPDGKPLAVEKTRKNRWRIQLAAPRAADVTVTYRVYAREMTVRTNWVEDGFAMLNGAPTFLTLADGVARPHDVRLVLPAAWKTTVTAPARPPPAADRITTSRPTTTRSSIRRSSPATRPSTSSRSTARRTTW